MFMGNKCRLRLKKPSGPKDRGPCPCGSGKAYLHCCWIQDVLWTKKENSREAFVELKDAAEERTFHSQDELQAFADDMMAVYNREPEADFSGRYLRTLQIAL